VRGGVDGLAENYHPMAAAAGLRSGPIPSTISTVKSMWPGAGERQSALRGLLQLWRLVATKVCRGPGKVEACRG
jgi:hypothetical protein